jgi:hypothetical protein
VGIGSWGGGSAEPAEGAPGAALVLGTQPGSDTSRARVCMRMCVNVCVQLFLAPCCHMPGVMKRKYLRSLNKSMLHHACHESREDGTKRAHHTCNPAL